jgi:catechol 2,3-dioxygenase-like lactoylglutathione lyase family enzyme
MSQFSLVILYVRDPAASAAFYTSLLGKSPVEQSPTFAMLPLGGETMLGLWIKTGVEPKATPAGGSEIAFTVPSREDVEATFRDWRSKKVDIVQEPTTMDFGHTFVGIDPDGHRLRVFVPSAG